jgi:hypothetical protein
MAFNLDVLEPLCLIWGTYTKMYNVVSFLLVYFSHKTAYGFTSCPIILYLVMLRIYKSPCFCHEPFY